MGLILILAIALNVVSLAVLFKQKNRFLCGSIGVAVCLLMSGLTVHYFLAENPFILTESGLLWFLLVGSFTIGVVGLLKRTTSLVLVAASLHLFLVLPTIFSIGLILLLLALAEIVVATYFYLKIRERVSFVGMNK
ncbi:pheromone shutdown protein TraB [Alkalihalobacillus xiaoxiensis]|uniref:Pheromone shutdown protein TraB n=1 Tax=Shouchella xiaoxiensis TaxID=766895 RepID=A0ABS2SUB8_9BACI|nr:hypothetical protein [Shouchella xiaoxiensis]MBM7837837.1 pheromone shutdown protein TraB [Shouchella xiaoxiensis]